MSRASPYVNCRSMADMPGFRKAGAIRVDPMPSLRVAVARIGIDAPSA
jgi:hypothetical protein